MSKEIDVKAFAFAASLFWGLGLFALTWWVIAFDGASGEPTVIARLYRGYSLSAGGSVIGLLWALADGLIGGAIFASLYNAIAHRVSGESRAQST